MSVASGDTSSLPLVEKTTRNTFTLLLLLLNYTINLDRRMRWTQLGSSDESRWIWITLQFPRQLPFPSPRNSLSLGRANNFPRKTIQAARHGVFAARSSVRCGRCCIAEVRGDRPARGKTVARLELAPLLQLRAAPLFSHAQVYRHALPQYNIGHSERLIALQRLRAELPGLFFVGNYLRGPAIGNCVDLAMEAAENIATLSRST